MIAFLEEFNDSAEKKLLKLLNCRLSLSKRFHKGETASVLTFIGKNLAKDSADGIFIGTIEDYQTDDGQLLALGDLCKSIDIQIEAC